MEVLIGGAILAGVGLAAAQMFRDQKLAQKRVDNDQALVTYHQNLTKTLTIPQNCNANFTFGSSINAGPRTTLNVCSGAICSDLRGEASALPAANRVAYVSQNDFIDSSQYWQIESINIPATVSTTGWVRIEMHYRSNPKLQPSRKVRKDILLNARFSSGFRECFNSQESSVNNLQNDLCSATSVMGFSTSGAAVSIARWDEETQSCVPIVSNKVCSSDHVITGIGNDGVVRCRPTTVNGVIVPAGKINTTQANCTVGQRVKILFLNNQLQAVCE